MSIFSARLSEWMKEKGLNSGSLASLAGVNRQVLFRMIKGDRRPTDEVLEKLSQVPELGLPLEKLKAWRLLDEYPFDVILRSLHEPEARDFLIQNDIDIQKFL